MNLINVDLPRRTLLVHASVAALAAVGITTLAGTRGQSLLAIPFLTAMLTFGLLLTAPRGAGSTRSRRRGAGTTDPATGLATESVAREALAREFSAAQRGRPLAVVMIRIEDLDRFRSQHGKAVGDQLLRVTARTLARHRRGMHLAAPWGGEGTFVSILSGSDREGAAIYAARLRRDLMRPKGLPPHAGVSIGIAPFDMSMAEPKELVSKAMFALEKGAAAGGKVMVVG